MNITPVKTPFVAKKIFPNFVWDMATTSKTMYLTFDDGPTPGITHWALNTLKQYHAKATFFCIGKNIENHPDIFEAIINEGHIIGNHTHNHIKGWKTSTKDYLKNIAKTQDIINSKIVNQKSKIKNLFRPPYGQITSKQGKAVIQMGYHIIMWDVLSLDWDRKVSPEKCLSNVIENATNGSIIVFHDSIKASKNLQYVLPKTLDYFSNEGCVFKSLDPDNYQD